MTEHQPDRQSEVTWTAADGIAVTHERGRLRWSGTVDGAHVIKAIAVPDSTDAVLLLDPERRPAGVMPWHPFHNVVRVDITGTLIWRAELVAGESALKAWFGVHWDDDSLHAVTWSYRARLDPDTGRITATEFTK